MEKTIKKCKKHGLTEFGRYKTEKYFHCIKCEREREKRKGKNKRNFLIEYKGGKCEICGYNRCTGALELHHLDPSEKEFELARNSVQKKSYEACKKEADKCVLLCANCHREVHNGTITLEEIRNILEKKHKGV